MEVFCRRLNRKSPYFNKKLPKKLSHTSKGENCPIHFTKRLQTRKIS